jgi:hypothetical protein
LSGSHLEDDLWGAEACSEHYATSERDTAETALQDAAQHALSQYCSLFSGVAEGLNLRYIIPVVRLAVHVV